jgi:hypothetical protein
MNQQSVGLITNLPQLLLRSGFCISGTEIIVMVYNGRDEIVVKVLGEAWPERGG